MKYYSTRNKQEFVSLREAVLSGLAPDGGLYMPETFPKFPLELNDGLSFPEIAYSISKPFLEAELEDAEIKALVEDAFDFDVPVKEILPGRFVVELFHGPTMAFKDFGARFMARLMSKFQAQEDKELTVLVATSGDTGSAVAQGFYKVPGIKVVLLYPKGQVSPLQEQQLTTVGENITALEVTGSFDDCQKMVKTAFSDSELNEQLNLTAANSINIARLIPQSFYYAWASAKIGQTDINFSVPSGNFGNLTAGLFLKFMGLNFSKFIASTNVNDTFPRYLENGEFNPRDSLQTISNAMDVGNPSNFERLQELYNNSLDKIKLDIVGARYTDEQTMDCMKRIYKETNYVLDPHGAVGWLGIEEHAEKDKPAVLLETAHPAKFHETVSETLGIEVGIPKRLKDTLDKEKVAIPLGNRFADLKELLSS